MLLREVIDCESTYNKTPEGKASVKTADNALLATSGKLFYGKNFKCERWKRYRSISIHSSKRR